MHLESVSQKMIQSRRRLAFDFEVSAGCEERGRHGRLIGQGCLANVRWAGVASASLGREDLQPTHRMTGAKRVEEHWWLGVSLDPFARSLAISLTFLRTNQSHSQ